MTGAAAQAEDLQGEACRRVREYVGIARGLGIALPEVEVVFDLKGMAAGQARLHDGVRPRIRLNPVLLAENGEEFLTHTIPHEVAHLAVFYHYRRRRVRPHGPEWQQLMRRFGAEPRATHTFDVSNSRTRRLRTYRYACTCREVELTSIRHNRARRGVRYYCNECGGRLRPIV